MPEPMPDLKKPVRKTLPKTLAVIDADGCTGCGACMEICPAGCIVKIVPQRDMPGLQGWCEIDWDRCLGCKLCIRIPGKRADPHETAVCPWGAIEMVPVEDLTAAVERMTGPGEFVEANRARLLAAARRQIELARQA